MQDAIIGVQAGGADAFVRVPLGLPFAAILDAGADGIVVPTCATPPTTPPRPSPGPTRPTAVSDRATARAASRCGLDPSARPCVVQIETRRGVAAAAAIAAVPGVDALAVGSADLTTPSTSRCVSTRGSCRPSLAAVRAAPRRLASFGVAGSLAGAAPEGTGLVISGTDIRLFGHGARAGRRPPVLSLDDQDSVCTTT